MEGKLLQHPPSHFTGVFLVVMAVPALVESGGADPNVAFRADTPQALVDTYCRARKQKDWRTCFQCYDSKRSGQLLMGMFYALGLTRDAELSTIVKKHLKIEFTNVDELTIPGLRQDNRVPDELLLYEALQKRVEDLPGFVSEFCRRLAAMGQEAFDDLDKVKEIKIQGDRAVGTLTLPPIQPMPPTLSSHSPQKVPATGDNPSTPAPPVPPGNGQPEIGLVFAPWLPGPERKVPIHFRKISGNWFLTLPDPPAPLTGAERARQLQTEVDSLWVVLSRSGRVLLKKGGGYMEDPSWEMRLSVQPFMYTSNDPNVCLARITQTQAKKLIDHLAAEGYLNQAVEPDKQKIPQPDFSQKIYCLQVRTQNLSLHEDLGWGPATLKRLDGLRAVLSGDAAKAMDVLLAKPAEDWKKWERKSEKPLPTPKEKRQPLPDSGSVPGPYGPGRTGHDLR